MESEAKFGQIRIEDPPGCAPHPTHNLPTTPITNMPRIFLQHWSVAGIMRDSVLDVFPFFEPEFVVADILDNNHASICLAALYNLDLVVGTREVHHEGVGNFVEIR